MQSQPAPGEAPYAAAILAAGEGSRFGGAKLAQPVSGRPLVAWPVQAAQRAGCRPVLVVTGFHQEAVAEALDGAGAEVLVNPSPQRGMGSSLALAARRALELGAAGLVVMLGDMPLIGPGLVAQVVKAARESGSGAAAAGHNGQRGHPVAFSADWLERLAGLGGDAGARDILAGLGDELALVPAGEESRLDVDTPKGLERASEAMTNLSERAQPALGGAEPLAARRHRNPQPRNIIMSEKCAVFIDGGYLDSLLYDVNVFRIDFSRFAEKLADGRSLLRTYYYHCLPFEPEDPTPEDIERMDGKRKFFYALSNLPRFEVRLGYVVPRGRDMNGRQLFQQKGVDVQLAVDVVRLSFMRSIGHCCLVAGDGDYNPMVQTAKDAGVVMHLFHGEGPSSRVSDKLHQGADERTLMNRDFFNDCRL